MRKRFLVKPALQLKHLAWTLGVVLFAFASCYLLFERQVNIALSHGPLDQAAWLLVRSNLRLGFSFAALALLIGVGLENYFFFHSVAGPMYALEKGINRLASGDFENTVYVRKNDQLSEVVQAFEEMKKKIGTRMENHEKTAQLLTQELERLMTTASPETIDNLRKRLEAIRTSSESRAA